jgi:hypothetical protein
MDVQRGPDQFLPPHAAVWFTCTGMPALIYL